MSAVAERTNYTPEDLLAMPDGDRYELVDGELLERNRGSESSAVAAVLLAELLMYVRDRQLGQVLGADGGYRCFRNPRDVRYADVSFISGDRLPDGRLPKGHARICPDLAVEVVSPNDLFYEVERKVREYQDAGVLLVWVVNPEERTVTVHRQDGSVSRLREGAVLSGEQVVPGFTCAVSAVFPAPASEASPSA
jgi:Uma2 family endonuclease